MLSSKDVTKIIGVSRETLRMWRIKGILVPDISTPTGEKYYYSEEQIEEYMKKYVKRKHSIDKSVDHVTL